MSHSNKIIEELAAGFVMGTLSLRERRSVILERLYNPKLDRRILELESALGAVVDASVSGADPQKIWARIERALTTELVVLADKGVESFQDGEWQPHSDGIQTKQLWSDETILIRCDPGGFEAEHQQPSDQDEHIIVIAGDLRLGGRSFTTGDYICVPADSEHQRMDSSGGCILFTQYKNVRS